MQRVNEAVLREASKRFGADSGSIKLLGNYSNSVYEFRRDGESFILKIMHESPEYINALKGALDWINYLANCQVSVPRAIFSQNDNLIEEIDTGGSLLLVTAFEKAKGKLVDVENPAEWNDRLFWHWGEVMGKIHALTKQYRVKVTDWKRNEWNEDQIFEPDFQLPVVHEKVLCKWKEKIAELSILPKDRNSYGLVHNDLHQENFYILSDQMTVFDFDDCGYNWFACDIAIALYHALESIKFNQRQKRSEFAKRFLSSFLDGYSTENILEDCWYKRIPEFLEYRRMFVYIVYMTYWDLSSLDREDKLVLRFMRNTLEKDIPYVDELDEVL